MIAVGLVELAVIQGPNRSESGQPARPFSQSLVKGPGLLDTTLGPMSPLKPTSLTVAVSRSAVEVAGLRLVVGSTVDAGLAIAVLRVRSPSPTAVTGPGEPESFGLGSSPPVGRCLIVPGTSAVVRSSSVSLTKLSFGPVAATFPISVVGVSPRRLGLALSVELGVPGMVLTESPPSAGVPQSALNMAVSAVGTEVPAPAGAITPSVRLVTSSVSARGTTRTALLACSITLRVRLR